MLHNKTKKEKFLAKNKNLKASKNINAKSKANFENKKANINSNNNIADSKNSTNQIQNISIQKYIELRDKYILLVKNAKILKDQYFKIKDDNTKLQTSQKELQEYKKIHEKLFSKARELKRAESDAEEKVKYANVSLAKEIINPLDWLENVVENATEKDNPWVKGLGFVLGEFVKILKEYKIEPIDVKIGDKFDIETSEIIDKQSSDKFKNKNYVIKINRKGYKLNERVIRHCSVIVSK